MKSDLSIHIIAMAALGEGISGSDRIFIELSREWSKKHKVFIYVWEEGKKLIERQNLLENKKLKIIALEMGIFCKMGFFICYLNRIFRSFLFSLQVELFNNKSTIVYSASEFPMDSLPAFILKLRFPRSRWVASWYQTAPNPFMGFVEGVKRGRYRLNALFYYLAQIPGRIFINLLADKVLVNNQNEKREFSGLNERRDVHVVLGAVKLEEINKFLSTNPKLLTAKMYDAVFQGRFHPQKGAVELVEIWRMVVNKIPNARLAMIGDGPLRKNIEYRIKNLGLEKNIKLFGYLFDGPEKYSIFSQSKIVVHPAFYDSGGMASAEAMAFGLPCVGFNLRSYKDYYPNGMLKVSRGDLKAFTLAIIKLLKNEKLQLRLGKSAQKLVESKFSWKERAREVLDSITL